MHIDCHVTGRGHLICIIGGGHLICIIGTLNIFFSVIPNLYILLSGVARGGAATPPK